jgi:hypothetical protein
MTNTRRRPKSARKNELSDGYDRGNLFKLFRIASSGQSSFFFGGAKVECFVLMEHIRWMLAAVIERGCVFFSFSDSSSSPSRGRCVCWLRNWYAVHIPMHDRGQGEFCGWQHTTSTCETHRCSSHPVHRLEYIASLPNAPIASIGHCSERNRAFSQTSPPHPMT